MNARLVSAGLIGLGGLCLVGGIGLLIVQVIQPVSITAPQQQPTVPPTAVLAGVTIEPPLLLDSLPLMPVMAVEPATQTTTIPSPAATIKPSVTARPHPPTATSPAPAPLPTLPMPLPPDRIIIPSLELDAPVVPVGWQNTIIDSQTYSQWEVPNAYAGGWHETSARVGEIGNLVINGHHNIEGGVFQDLVKLVPSDLIILSAGGETFHYQVVQTMILPERDQPLATRQANARWLLPTPDERVTLITCWPSDDNSHRLVVIALPLE
ncbi:MAG: sortase [Anaerolineales bacterium]|nr:sortase [Anaerolineales bacterium]